MAKTKKTPEQTAPPIEVIEKEIVTDDKGGENGTQHPVPESKEIAPRPTPPTQEIITARFNQSLTRLKYQEALQKFQSYSITPENIAEAQEKIKRVRAFIRQLGEIKDEGKRPSIIEGRMWDAAYNSFLTPLQNALTEKDESLQKVTFKIAEENRKKENERLRVEGIKKEIDNFVLTQSQAIAGTLKTNNLISIEKLIGSHKANKTRYQEFLPDLIERCNELTPLIKNQKERIKELEELEKQRIAAEKAQDDRKLMELQERRDEVSSAIEEGKIVVQEMAISQATKPDEVTTLQPMQQEIKYRRTSWKWEVTDIRELQKKMPHLVIVIPDKDKIDELLKTKKADGSLKDTEELNYFGIRIYLEKLA